MCVSVCVCVCVCARVAILLFSLSRLVLSLPPSLPLFLCIWVGVFVSTPSVDPGIGMSDWHYRRVPFLDSCSGGRSPFSDFRGPRR